MPGNGDWLANCCKQTEMRAFIAIVVIAGLGGLYLWQKKSESPTAANADTEPAAQHASPAPVTAASPVHQVSEHNWMKRSLDRARDVRDQARTQTRDSQNP